MADLQDYIKGWEACLIGKHRDTMSQEERIERLLKRLHPKRFYNRVPVGNWKMCYTRFDGRDEKGNLKYVYLDKNLIVIDPNVLGAYKTTDKPQWFDIKEGEQWGNFEVTAFMKTTFVVPEEFHKKPMYFLFFVGGDGLLKINGEIRQGCDCFHTEIMLSDLAIAGKKLELEVETYQKHQVDADPIHKLTLSEMAILDKEVEELYWDMSAAFSASNEEFADPEIRAFILHHLDEAFKIVDVFETDHNKFHQTAVKAREYLQKTLYSANNMPSPGKVTGVGHSHLDYVYAWEFGEFIRKIGRTHSTQLQLMKEFPFFKFSQSQAITYMEMKRHYPKIYEEIKKMVKAGRWEILGIFYSECDCNIPNGESFIRNIMIGKKFFEKEFGITPKISWQCDLFGVMWSLPQILKKSGVEYFVTHKMPIWNSDNRWPYNIYWWEGPDGTRILAHSPSSHIIQTCEGYQLQRHWNRFSEKLQAKESLYTYGWGDGGSGVTREMLHRIKRYKNFPGVPRIEPGFAEEFFKRVSNNIKGRKDVPVWSNELYLETHRGSLTTQGKLKKLNRYSEILLRNAEFIGTLAAKFSDFKYPKEEFMSCWEEVVKAQFHDGVTGTHTMKAYKDVTSYYEKAIKKGESLLEESINSLSKKINTEVKGEPIIILNTHAWERTEPVKIPFIDNAKILDENGNEVITQIISSKNKKYILFEAKNIPPCGYSVYSIVHGKSDKKLSDKSEIVVKNDLLENNLLRVKLDKNGHIISLYDKINKRELIPEGSIANEFQLFEDISGFYEAWDLHNTNLVLKWDVRKADSVKVVEKGPVRCAIEVKKTIHNSKLTQKIILYRNSSYIDFETTVNWNEIHRVLKVAFPLDIVAFNARYDIAFANMDRPTHRTTSWEKTKFEVVGHKWADLSDAGYGVSLINDCKYGYDCEKNVLRLTLLRAPKYPNPQSDIYEHEFTYRIYCHKYDFRRGMTIRNAWELNSPLIVRKTSKHKGKLPSSYSFINVENENIILETLKIAENDNSVIIRFVEHWGQKDILKSAINNIKFKYRETDLMEKDISNLKNGPIVESIGAFEIKTYRCLI